jgi:hypothetical protein
MDVRMLTDPLFLLLQNTGAVRSERSFAFQDGPEPWVFFLLILPGVIFLSIFLYRKEKAGISTRTRALLIGLRCLLLILLFLFLFRPVLLTSRVVVEKPAAVLLVDDSASMREHDSYTDGQGLEALASTAGLPSKESVASLSRRELVQRVFESPRNSILATLEERYDLKMYGFGSGLTPIGGFEDLNADGESTRLGDALAGTVRDYRGSGLSALVLLSDGRSNRGRNPRDAAFLALNQQVPVHTVGVGDPSEPRNVEVTGVNAPTVALVGDEITFKVNLFSSGYGERPVALLLKSADGRTVLSTRDFALKESGGEQQEHLYWRPEQEGDYTLRVEVPLLPGEQDEKDNVLTHVLRVESARIRVLYVEGYPRWEYRFLKNLLLRAENFEVQVFLQSADPDFIQESSGAMPTLTCVPRDRKSLMDYHVIIFGDVDPAALGASWEESRGILNNIKYFVEAGGGFLMQAGELHSPSSYAETAIADILPVVIGNYEGELMAAEGSSVDEETSFFRPKLENFLTPHEILLLEKDPVRNRRLWEDPEYGLPGFLWYYPVERGKPGAEILARHPRISNRYGHHVILATTFYPSGRTLFLGVDSTWRWRSPYGDRYMEKFWRGAVRYLAQNKLRRKDYRYELYTDRSLYDLNERIQITARVLDADYRLSSEPMQEMKLMGPGGVVEELTLNQVVEGEYGRSIVRSEPGVYQLWIGGEDGNVETRHALTSFSVTVPRLESENPILDRQLLGDVARATGGQYLDLHEAGKLLGLLDDEQRIRRLSDPERHDLWSTWWGLLLFVGVFAAEWIIRKWHNLL